MAFDVSKITSAVNSYLYSISDVNKLISEGTAVDSQNGLNGIFQKYLNKAIDISENEDSTSTLNSYNDVGALLSLTLPEVSDVTKDKLTTYDRNLTVAAAQKALTASSSEDVGTGTDDNTYISGDALADRINSAFSGLDIKGEIEKSIQSHNRVSEIDEINSYNAARIKSYKLNQDTSVFGDFKL